MPGALAGLRAAGGPMECIATADVSQQFAALAEKGGEGRLAKGFAKHICRLALRGADAEGDLWLRAQLGPLTRMSSR